MPGAMEYRRLGNTGLEVSALSIGGWLTHGGSIDEATSHEVLARAEDGGMNYVDLADVYANGRAEEVFGRFLKDRERHRFVIASKVFWPMSDDPNDRGLSRKHIVESVERSLKRLGTDYLDLYFCHREDPDTPLTETMRAMEDLVRQGKVLYWGTSCFSPSTLLEAQGKARLRGWTPPVVEQPPYSLLDRHIEKRVVPLCRTAGMGVVVFSPLAGGALTGKYDDGTAPDGSRGAQTKWLDEVLTPENLPKLRRFSALARERDVAPAQLALAWAMAQPGISSVITGATSVAQVEQNLGALDVDIDDGLARELDELFPR